MMGLNRSRQRAQSAVYTNAMTAFALLLSLASTALVAQDARKPAFYESQGYSIDSDA